MPQAPLRLRSLRGLLDRQHKTCRVQSGRDAVAGLRGNCHGVRSGRSCGVGFRAVMLVVVARIAAGGAQHGHNANQSHERKPRQPLAAARSPGQAAQAQNAWQQKRPGNGTAVLPRPIRRQA